MDIGSQALIYKNILKEKANALLFNEETLNYYQYSLQVFPQDFVKYAISYLMKLMSMLLKYNNDHYKELSRLIIKTAIKNYDLSKKDIDLFYDKSCIDITNMMQQKIIDDA